MDTRQSQIATDKTLFAARNTKTNQLLNAWSGKRRPPQTAKTKTARLFSILVCLAFSVAQTVAQSCDPDKDCHPSSQDLINLSFGARTLTVSSTCGSAGQTTFYRKAESTLDDSVLYCNASSPHPKELMYDKGQDIAIPDFSYEDPKLRTYWQSENCIASLSAAPTEQFIELNLTDRFLIRRIRVIFLSPGIDYEGDNSDLRPLGMVIERSLGDGGVWQPWRYYADSCALRFGGAIYEAVDGSTPDYGWEKAVCRQTYYGGDVATHSGWGYGRQEVRDEGLGLGEMMGYGIREGGQGVSKKYGG